MAESTGTFSGEAGPREEHFATEDALGTLLITQMTGGVEGRGASRQGEPRGHRR